MSAALDVAALYEEHDRSLRRYVERFCPPRSVDDVLQDAYADAHAYRGEVVSSPGALLFGIVRKHALLRNRNRRTRDAYVQAVEDVEVEAAAAEVAAPPPVSDPLTRAEFAALAEAITALPPRVRQSFVLKKVYGMKNSEIADELGVARNTVCVHLVRAYKLLQGLERWQ